MASPRRIAKLESFLKRELGEILLHRLKDPRMGFISVASVQLSRDCRHLKVGVSVLGSRADKSKMMHALRGARGFVGRQASKHLQLRSMPEISFVLDESIERGIEICKIIDRVSAEDRSKEDNAEQE